MPIHRPSLQRSQIRWRRGSGFEAKRFPITMIMMIMPQNQRKVSWDELGSENVRRSRSRGQLTALAIELKKRVPAFSFDRNDADENENSIRTPQQSVSRSRWPWLATARHLLASQKATRREHGKKREPLQSERWGGVKDARFWAENSPSCPHAARDPSPAFVSADTVGAQQREGGRATASCYTVAHPVFSRQPHRPQHSTTSGRISCSLRLESQPLKPLLLSAPLNNQFESTMVLE